MLAFSILFIVSSLTAGVLGFGHISGTAEMITKVLFIIFFMLFLLALFERRKA